MIPKLNIISKDELINENENENIINYFLPLLNQNNIQIIKAFGTLSIYDTDITLITTENKIINYKIDIYNGTNLIILSYNNKTIKIPSEVYFNYVHSHETFYKLITEYLLKII